MASDGIHEMDVTDDDWRIADSLQQWLHRQRQRAAAQPTWQRVQPGQCP
jgi:hypothetical protein